MVRLTAALEFIFISVNFKDCSSILNQLDSVLNVANRLIGVIHSLCVVNYTSYLCKNVFHVKLFGRLCNILS